MTTQTVPTQSMTGTFEHGTGQVRRFMNEHFLHYNSREVVAAARGYEAHIDAGGRMLISLAGAMSTARLGRILSRMIRAGKVHAISCTGANLEEDLFVLLAGKEYENCPNWRALSAEDEKALYERGMNRVTDTCIPETVMRHLENRLIALWKDAAEKGERKFPYEYLFDLIRSGELAEHYQLDPQDSWMVAAAEKGIPVYSPGWEDSTTGNIFAASVMRGAVPHHQCVKTGTEQMQDLAEWYRKNMAGERAGSPSVGFFQVGGGIAGDFAICAVPMMIQDLKQEDTRFWGYFCQTSDATTSYGGYSGAVPNEKITWGKLDVDTPKFMIESDATIVVPLIFAYVLGD
ncbi:MAG: deoxyhypusine synthase family protein [Phycisphaeraceae bacterium]